MTDNCDMCGKFMKDYREDTNHCDKCLETLTVEGYEAEIGIGDGKICFVNEDTCRHCISKWPMDKNVFNAVYGGAFNK